MDFEPQKFFIGLVDSFSVLMPGAVLAYVGKDCGGAAARLVDAVRGETEDPAV